MITLLHLPVEVLDQILSIIATENWDMSNNARNNLENIMNLCLVNKDLYALARRHKYTVFKRDYELPVKADLRLFLRDILQEPDLMKEVKYVSILNIPNSTRIVFGAPEIPSTDDRVEAERYGFPPETMPIFYESAKSLTGPLLSQHYTHFAEYLDKQQCCPIAYIILLLSFATNVEDLTLDVPHITDTYNIASSRNYAKDAWPLIYHLHTIGSTWHQVELPPFSRLRNLSLCAKHSFDGEREWFDLDPWTPLLQLPTLRSLYTLRSRSSLATRPQTLSITDLNLEETFELHSTDIHRILRSCNTLKAISITHTDNLSDPGDWYTTTYEGVAYLDHSIPSLQFLHWAKELHLRSMLLDLAAFPNLTHVTVSICSLFKVSEILQSHDSNHPSNRNHESNATAASRKSAYADPPTPHELVNCFPPSIQQITFDKCPSIGRSAYAADTALLAFAEAAPKRLANLRMVRYLYWFDRGNKAQQVLRLAGLKEKFSSIGVVLRLRGYAFGDS